MNDDFSTRTEVASLRRRVAALEAAFAQLARRRTECDPRLPTVKAMICAFSGSDSWPADELIDDARRAAPALWNAIDGICGNRGDARYMAVRFGIWLGKHADADDGADGLRLVRDRKVNGAWHYAVIESGG